MSIIKHVTLQKIVAHDFRYDPRTIIVRVIALAGKTNVPYYTCKLWYSSLTRTDTTKDLGVQLYSKLHFRAHVRRHFLPVPKDARLNTNCALFIFYS